VLSTKPLLGSRRHCKDGSTMASHDEVLDDQPAIGRRTLPVDEITIFHLLMGTAKFSFSTIHVYYLCTLSALLILTPWNVACVSLTHWDAEIPVTPLSISLVLGRLLVGCHYTIYISPTIIKLMAKHKRPLRVVIRHWIPATASRS